MGFQHIIARIMGQNPVGNWEHLQLDASGQLKVTGGGGGTEYNRDDAAGAADIGKLTLVVRSDAGGSLVSADGDYAPLQVDALGALRVSGGGGGTQYEEDAAHASGATGTLALAVRNDILAALADADGDYSVLQTDVFGQLYVREMFSSAIATAIQSLSKAEDAAHVSGDMGLMALAVRSDAGGSLVSLDGDYTPFSIDANGALRVAGGGGGTEYNEDEAHVSGAVGKLALAVRNDLGGALADTNGDYTVLQTDVFGQLFVREMFSSTVATAVENIYGAMFEEDAAHVSGNRGIQALAVRQDVLAALADADGDYTPLLTDVFGQLYVREMFSSAIATAIQSLSKSEDAAHTSGDAGLMLLGVRKDEPASLASDSLDYTPFQFDSIGNVRTSSFVTGDVAHDAVDAGNPIKVGGKARTANPTLVAAGDRVDAGFDTAGRQIFTPVQIRGLRQTAYVALATGSAFGTEKALLAGVAATYHDLLYIMGANDSSVAAKVVIRASTGGNPQFVLEIPANGTAGISLPVPLPQDHADASWTVDADDISGTNLYISALFSKEA